MFHVLQYITCTSLKTFVFLFICKLFDFWKLTLEIVIPCILMEKFNGPSY